MIKVAAFEAKTQFSALLDKVEQGEDIIITRHGKVVARLVKAEAASHAEVDAAIERIKQRREGVTTGGLGWKTLRDEGRKY